SRRQVARRRVDGVAEQQELHQRHQHDHGERHPVALELDELLDQHRAGAMHAFGECAHWKLSLARPIRSMNTSSSEGSDFTQCKSGSLRYGAMAASSASGSRPETCRLVPNGATESMPGLPASSVDKFGSSSPETVKVRSFDSATTCSTVPWVSKVP